MRNEQDLVSRAFPLPVARPGRHGATARWTTDAEAIALLGCCAARPPARRRHVARYAMTSDEWTGFEGRRAARLADIRAEWIANAAGFSWEGPRPGDPPWESAAWSRMRATFFALSDRQPSVEDAILDALAQRKRTA